MKVSVGALSHIRLVSLHVQGGIMMLSLALDAVKYGLDCDYQNEHRTSKSN